MKALTKKQLNLWPVYLKDPKVDVSSYSLNAVVLASLNSEKFKFNIDRVIEISNYSYCPLTKIYLNHEPFNSGDEAHFFTYKGEVVGSLVIKIASEQISNWRRNILISRIIDYLTHALVPLEIIRNQNPFLFVDNYSIKSGFSLHLEVEGENFSLFSVNVYLDLAQEVGVIFSTYTK